MNRPYFSSFAFHASTKPDSHHALCEKECAPLNPSANGFLRSRESYVRYFMLGVILLLYIRTRKELAQHNAMDY